MNVFLLAYRSILIDWYGGRYGGGSFIVGTLFTATTAKGVL